MQYKHFSSEYKAIECLRALRDAGFTAYYLKYRPGLYEVRYW